MIPQFPGTLSQGTQDYSNVLLLQQRLNQLSYKGENKNALVEDGSFGSNVKYAVASFQSKNNLTINGIVDETTWNKLFSQEAIPAPTGINICPYSIKTSSGVKYACLHNYSKLSSPPNMFGYSDIWHYECDNTLKTQANNKFSEMEFLTGAGKSSEYQRILLSANIIFFQYKMGYTVTGRLDSTLITQLTNAASQGLKYSTIKARTGGNVGSRPNFPRIDWTGNNGNTAAQKTAYNAASNSTVMSKLEGTKQDVSGYTVVPANGGNTTKYPGETTPYWTALAPWIAVRWAEFIQVAVRETGKDYNIERFRVSSFDSGFRTFFSQEYYYHIDVDNWTHTDQSGNSAAVPGRSSHGVGYAIDFNTLTGKGESNKDEDLIPMPISSAEGKFLEKYGHEHGWEGNKEKKFTLKDGSIEYRYYETWHWNILQ